MYISLGGIDSSIVSSVCAAKLREQGKKLHTFSFDFKDNSKYFKSNAFQPEQDRPYVDMMVAHIGSDHTYLTCNYSDLADYLYTSVESRDMPTMADVDSSLLYFCSLVAKEYKVVLTGNARMRYLEDTHGSTEKNCFHLIHSHG